LSVPAQLNEILRKRLEKGLIPQVLHPKTSNPALQHGQKGTESKPSFLKSLYVPEKIGFLVNRQLSGEVSQRMIEHICLGGISRRPLEGFCQMLSIKSGLFPKIQALAVGHYISKDLGLVLAMSSKQKLIFGMELDEIRDRTITLHFPEAGQSIKLGQEVLSDVEVSEPAFVLDGQIRKGLDNGSSEEACGLGYGCCLCRTGIDLYILKSAGRRAILEDESINFG